MGRFFITHESGIVVNYTEGEWADSKPHPVCNFGDRQSDAIEFRDDCQKELFSMQRVKILMRIYTPHTKFRYAGKGTLKKQTQND